MSCVFANNIGPPGEDLAGKFDLNITPRPVVLILQTLLRWWFDIVFSVYEYFFYLAFSRFVLCNVPLLCLFSHYCVYSSVKISSFVYVDVTCHSDHFFTLPVSAVCW